MLAILRALPLGWWLLVSVLLYVVAANLSWRLQSWTTGFGRYLGSLVRHARRLSAVRALGGLVYNIGIPYVAVLLGVLDARLAGLNGSDWIVSLQAAAALTAATAFFLWLHARRMGGMPTSSPADGSPVLSVPVALWLMFFQQAHWAFYRAALAAWLGAYTGACAGLVLVLLKWLLNPFWRQAWRREHAVPGLPFDVTLALTSAIAFILTANLWACLGIHATLALLWRTSAYGQSPAWPTTDDVSLPA